MKPGRRIPVASVMLLSALFLAACSGDSPVTPSSTSQGIVLKGTVQGASGATAAALAASSASTSSAAGEIVVTVQENPAITTTVGPDGSFTLRGLPPGSFTLIFTQDGAVIGTLSFGGVLPNQEITITVDVSSGEVRLLEEERNGIGHGDLEVEGVVDQVLVLDPAGESRFLIRGFTVLALPGQTAVREGNQARTVEDVTAGRRVHVKGEWLEPEAGVQPLLAHEIKLQGDEEEDEDDDSSRGCNISGGRVGSGIELQGDVLGGSAAGFELRVKGNRAKAPVGVDASGARFQCHPASGPKAPTPDQCKAKVKAGAQVHVSGTLLACTASSASVRASKVIVQK